MAQKVQEGQVRVWMAQLAVIQLLEASEAPFAARAVQVLFVSVPAIVQRDHSGQ